MIKSVRVFRNGCGCVVRYESGKSVAYSNNSFPKSVMSFILDENVYCSDDNTGFSTLYRKRG